MRCCPSKLPKCGLKGQCLDLQSRALPGRGTSDYSSCDSEGGLISRVGKADVPCLLHQVLGTENSCPLLSSLKTPMLSDQKFSTARSFFNFTSTEKPKEAECHLGHYNGQSERSVIPG